MNAIEVQNLKKHFGDVKAVDGVSFEVEQGEVFGFLGPNGAGKTTTIRCMMDFLRPTDGSIRILGKDAQKEGVQLKHEVGFLSGQVRLVDHWTAQEHVRFFRSLDGNESIAQDLIERLQLNPTMKAKKLSSGNKQKLGLVLALMAQPKILIMDEPTNALDPLLQQQVYELVEEARDRGTTVFMSSHNLAEVERVCSRVGVIRKGKMVATESITELRRKRLYTINVFADDVAPFTALTAEDGIDLLNELPGGVALAVKGEISPILGKIAAMHPKDIEVLHARLEDIFLEFYE